MLLVEPAARPLRARRRRSQPVDPGRPGGRVCGGARTVARPDSGACSVGGPPARRRHPRAGLARGKCATGRAWVYVRDDRPFGGPDPPAALFRYSRDRSGDHPVLRTSGTPRHLETTTRHHTFHTASNVDPDQRKPAFRSFHEDVRTRGKVPAFRTGFRQVPTFPRRYQRKKFLLTKRVGTANKALLHASTNCPIPHM